MQAWTPESIKTLKKLYPCRSTVSVAETVGRTVEAVKRKAARLGLKKTAKHLGKRA